MGRRTLRADEDGVSPVVGVVILVAVVVVLGSVAAVFFLGGTEEGTKPPDASFGFDFENEDIGCDTVTVSYEGGEAIDAEHLVVSVKGTSRRGHEVNGLPDELEAGDTFSLPPVKGQFPCFTNGSTVQIFWESPDDGERHRIAVYNVPATSDHLRPRIGGST